jgi:hypothetical protein
MASCATFPTAEYQNGGDCQCGASTPQSLHTDRHSCGSHIVANDFSGNIELTGGASVCIAHDPKVERSTPMEMKTVTTQAQICQISRTEDTKVFHLPTCNGFPFSDDQKGTACVTPSISISTDTTKTDTSNTDTTNTAATPAATKTCMAQSSTGKGVNCGVLSDYGEGVCATMDAACYWEGNKCCVTEAGSDVTTDTTNTDTTNTDTTNTDTTNTDTSGA